MLYLVQVTNMYTAQLQKYLGFLYKKTVIRYTAVESKTLVLDIGATCIEGDFRNYVHML